MKSITSFLGRNGLFKSIGLDVYIRDTMANNDAETKTLCITPTTSKGLAARCEIEVPVSAIGVFVEAIGSQLKPSHPSDSEYGKWLVDSESANAFDNYLFNLFFFAKDGNADRLIAAFPEKFIAK